MPLEEPAEVGVERARDQEQKYNAAVRPDADRQTVRKQMQTACRGLPDGDVRKPLGRSDGAIRLKNATLSSSVASQTSSGLLMTLSRSLTRSIACLAETGRR